MTSNVDYLPRYGIGSWPPPALPSAPAGRGPGRAAASGAGCHSPLPASWRRGSRRAGAQRERPPYPEPSSLGKALLSLWAGKRAQKVRLAWVQQFPSQPPRRPLSHPDAEGTSPHLHPHHSYRHPHRPTVCEQRPGQRSHRATCVLQSWAPSESGGQRRRPSTGQGTDRHAMGTQALWIKSDASGPEARPREAPGPSPRGALPTLGRG